MKDLSFRPITPGDAFFLNRLYASTRQEELAVTGWPQEKIDAFLYSQFQAQHKFYQETFDKAEFGIVLLDQKPIGRLYVDRRIDEIRVIDISLLPEYRRRGIGRQLMQQVLDEGSARGLPVRIHVEHHNPAMRLYERLGFIRIGDTGVYYLMEREAKATQ